MKPVIRTALPTDEPQIMELLPSLADFTVPQGRNPDDLWQGDAALIKRLFMGRTPNTYALVALHPTSKVIGVAAYTLQPELLSREPSAHLEVLAVQADSRRQGIATALTKAVEVAAANMGAKSLTLHVFANNTNARGFYAAEGFGEELLRCYKPL